MAVARDKAGETMSEEKKVLHEERRRHQRKALNIKRGGVEFAVQIGGDVLTISEVHDVSISGIRLLLERSLNTGQELTLSAREGEFSISLVGNVRWCRKSTDHEGFEAGVEFSNMDMDNNILFFMSLRKYLDGFDDVPVKEI